MASSSTSSIQKSFKFDVFLSFRGEDTRKSFIDHLYHTLTRKGIKTYKDDESINQGKKIRDELIRSVEESKFYIIVFSENYASSSWCLEELVKIMECQKMDEHAAYPVFFDVEPTEIRKQTGCVKRAFAKHRNEKDAGKWRDALKEAADLAGWELKNTANGHEAKFIQQIVEKISLDLRCIDLNVDGKLVGMEARVKDVVSSLKIGIDDVRMIGIKGMGGGGKTTLARAVFDQISFWFEGSSFVENVREVSSGSLNGMKSLQEQVLYDVLKDRSIGVSGVSDGKIQMKKMLSGMKVLVVLDDVDDIEQLKALADEPNWFKAGSRVIITTRDEQVLLAHHVNFISDVNLLSHEEAICLLCRYAFGKERPIQGYEGLCEKVVNYAAGLPLTVSVLGSFLCGKSDYLWIDAIKRLKKIPLKETLKKLELSYNSLDDDYKEVFLDVACILKGWEENKAIRALESCGFHAKIGLKVLEQKSLITVSQFGYLGMHDHIEEMGKNIVRRLHHDQPHKHSRLWINEEIEDILASNSGTQETRCITFKSRNLELDPTSIMKGLVNMKELRFLKLEVRYCKKIVDFNDRELDEGSQCFPNALRYLNWYSYPFDCLPKNSRLTNLAELEMCGSKIVQLWEGGERKVLKKLRFIDLSNSKLRILDLRLIPNVETLNLQYCYDLVELGAHSGSQKLRFLNLGGSKLRALYFGPTPNLEVFDLENCKNLLQVHMHGENSKLRSINLSGTNLRSLDLGQTPNLEALEIPDDSNLAELHLGGEFQKLKSLELFLPELRTLDLAWAPKLKSLELLLPGPILMTLDLMRAPNLETLWVSGFDNLEELESFIGSIFGLQYLRKLTLSGSFPEFPKNLHHPECLIELVLLCTNISYLPNSICMLKHLKILILQFCMVLEQLPQDLGRLKCLEKLTLSHIKIKHLPNSICMLKQLKILSLKYCELLEQLPEDLGRLECLEQLHLLECLRLQDLPNSMCEMKHLKYINLTDCIRVKKLPVELGRVECLKELDIVGTGIRHLPQSISRLEGLCIYGLP